MTRLPPSASVANPVDGTRLTTPAAERNAGAISEMLRAHGPASGTALELASGTGQHVAAFAAALPDLHWHPTEIDALRRASIDAWVAEAKLANVAPARALDVTAPGWGADETPKDLIVLVNLLHLIPTPDAKTAVAEAARTLAPGGLFLLYGPFKRRGTLTSDGDIRFDTELRAADPAIGYKDDLDIARWLSDAGLSPIDRVEMPANNLAFLARKPTE